MEDVCYDRVHLGIIWFLECNFFKLLSFNTGSISGQCRWRQLGISIRVTGKGNLYLDSWFVSALHVLRRPHFAHLLMRTSCNFFPFNLIKWIYSFDERFMISSLIIEIFVSWLHRDRLWNYKSSLPALLKSLLEIWINLDKTIKLCLPTCVPWHTTVPQQR